MLFECVFVAQVLIAQGTNCSATVDRKMSRARATVLEIGIAAAAKETAVLLDCLQLLVYYLRATQHVFCNTTGQIINIFGASLHWLFAQTFNSLSVTPSGSIRKLAYMLFYFATSAHAGFCCFF
jgi:hypothetical protein